MCELVSDQIFFCDDSYPGFQIRTKLQFRGLFDLF